MKLRTLILISLMMQLSYAETFSCKMYDFSATDDIQPSSAFEIKLDVKKDEALINYAGEIEKADLTVANDGFVIGSGTGTDRYELHIITNKDVNFLDMYVHAMGEEYGIEGEELVNLSEAIKKVYSNKNINGSMVALASVQAFLSCEEK